MTGFGPIRQGRNVRFRLWAPGTDGVALVRPDHPPLPMEATGNGFHVVQLEGVPDGQRYMFRLGGLDVPDPASRAQAEDAAGWSVLVPGMPAPARNRALRPWHEAIIAEVHVGTATPEGTFAALAARLDHFAESGFTVVELMPVADFPGRWNWGYDGVLPYAPDTAYGTPQALRDLVDAAHGHGLGVMLDVVYNHFGPSGNFLHHYAGAFFTDRHQTPWGAAIDVTNPVVRRFFIDNAVMWLRDYDFDGLRFDAVHALPPDGVEPFLAELAAACRAVKPDAYLVLENDDNAARWLDRFEDARPRHYTAQWNDDIHHVWHRLATGETAGYYRDYAADAVAAAGRALAEGFVYQGEPSAHRGNRPRGEPSAHLPPDAFVAFVQNHDQIGNRPFGDRLASLVDGPRLRLLQFLLMLSPQVPLLFMGEEAELDTPFPFFCDLGDDLAEAVRSGRREEFLPFFETHEGSVEDLPDPMSRATFEAAKLPWDILAGPASAERLARFRELARLRRAVVWPLAGSRYRGAECHRSGDALHLRWQFEAGTLALAANPSGEAAVLETTGQTPKAPAPDARLGTVASDGACLRLGPWSAAAWSLGR